MPRFFFDFADDKVLPDELGTEFSDAHAARDAAITVLPDIARDEIGTGDSRGVLVLMREEKGRALFAAALTLSAKWLVDTAQP